MHDLKLLPCLVAALVAASAAAQPAPASPKPATGADTGTQGAPALKSLGWLEGCWRGTAASREFREHWMPLRGSMMLGVSQTVDEKGQTQSYEFLRLEPRSGSVYYVATPSGKAEVALKLESETTDKSDQRDDTIFTFVNPASDFPQVIAYRRAREGWLYASVEGRIGGQERQATYPMRRINCETGEVIAR